MRLRHAIQTASRLFIALFVLSSPALSEVPIKALPHPVVGAEGRLAPPDEQGRLRYIVRFAEPGARARHALARGGFEGFAWHDSGTRALIAEIMREQDIRLSQAARAFDRRLEPTHRYLATQSAVALWLWPEEAEQLAREPGIVNVQPDRVFKLDTYRGPEFIGAGAIWDGTAVPDGTGLLGEGMVVAIIDSGISDPAAQDAFANDAACGHGPGEADKKLRSALDCASASQGLCDGPDPVDNNSHGAHVAATAAGNRLVQGQTSPALQVPGNFERISGVAPCAHIRSYKVCPGRSCFFSQIQAAIESILLHADVDVANYSISGGNAPWLDLDRPKLELVEAGVLVAASAGNSGPTASTVSHRGPWMLSVAASTRDVNAVGGASAGDVLASFSSRGPTPIPYQNIQKPDITAPGLGIFAADVSYRASASGPGVPPQSLQDIVLTPGSATQLQTAAFSDRRITFDPGQNPEADGCEAFPEDFFSGAVALIRRGTCTFVEKIEHALQAGASLVLIHNSQSGGFALGTDGQPPSIDVFAMSGEHGEALRTFIENAGGEAMIDFSIPPAFDFKSGTSMSSPHVAGAALLVRQARPDWTPMEVASALRMTAISDGFKPDGSTPWDWDDVGSGRVDLTRAALAGLVMDENKAAFLAADPSSGGDVRSLNLPALRDADCWPDCRFVRTVRNSLPVPSQWQIAGQIPGDAFEISVEPSSFEFAGDASETQIIEIIITPGAQAGTDAFEFGAIILSEQSAASPQLHWTVAISGSRPPVATIAPSELNFSLPENGRSTGLVVLGNAGESELSYRVALAEVVGQALELGGAQLADESIQDDMNAPIELRIDSGIAVPIGAGAQQLVWFNRLTPQPLDLPFMLEEIRVGWAPGYGAVEAGHAYDVYVWTAPERDPLGTIELRSAVTGLSVTPGVGFKSIQLPEPEQITAADGDLLVAVVSRELIEEYFPAVRDGAGSQERSWLAYGFPGDVAGDPPVFAEAGWIGLIEEANAALAGNWTIRAYGTGGSACLQPGEVFWLAVSPESGSIPSASTQELQVQVDMNGLGGGTFEARLCIETNDPDQPIVVVPVTVSVDGAVLSPPVLRYAPASLSVAVVEGSTASARVELANDGEQTLFWSVDVGSHHCQTPAWLAVEPISGQLAADEQASVWLTLDAAELSPGDYSAVLCVDSTDPELGRIEVSILLEVAAFIDPIFQDRFEP